jgi:DNA polymerase-3 subunit alpha
MLPPDINESGPGFTPVEGAIRYGLSAIKGIGQQAVNPIIEARKERPFTSIFDFAERACEKGVGKRVIESLICAGALDSLKPESETLHRWRAALLATVDRAIECGARKKRERNSGQADMFGFGNASEIEEPQLSLESVTVWSHKELLAYERAAVGFYVSGHPLEAFVEKIGQLNCKTVADLVAAEPNSHVRLAGVVSDFTTRNTKKGDRYAFFRLEDLTGAGVKCVLWPEALKAKGKDAANDALLLVIGKLDGGNDSLPTIVCDEVSLLETARIPMRSFNSTYQDGRIETQALVIEFSDEASVSGMCEKVAQTLLAYPGNCDVFLDLYLRASGLKVRLRPGHSIRVSSAQNLQNELKAAGIKYKWVESQAATARPEPVHSVGSPRFTN